MRGVAAALDRRLQPDHPRPIAVGLSGGGDSVALTLMADAWAKAHGRELLVLSVDHGLQPEARAWVEACREVAGRLGRPFQALAWTGEKPATGLPAAARAARHRLLSDAARGAGAEVVLLGHTADDIAEARAMRAAGATTPEPREWAPSPAWPEGRGVFLLRPMLDVSRAELRAWLSGRGERWIEDPANDDPRYARSRARRAGAAPVCRIEPAGLPLGAEAVEVADALRLDRGPLRASEDLERLIGVAAVCAGGGDRRPAARRLTRLAEAIRGPDDVTATLAGARVVAHGDTVIFARESGEAARGGLAPEALPVGRAAVWDGRYEFIAGRPGLEVRRLAGLASRLPADQRRRLGELPAAVRGALPAVVGDGGVGCPVLAAIPDVAVRPLVGERLRAASGLIDRERA